MSRNSLILALLILCLCVVGYLIYDRSKLGDECARLRRSEIQLKRDAELEKQAWSTLYKDCVRENDALVSKLKDYSTLNESRLSN